MDRRNPLPVSDPKHLKNISRATWASSSQTSHAGDRERHSNLSQSASSSPLLPTQTPRSLHTSPCQGLLQTQPNTPSPGWLLSWVRPCSRCLVINPSAVTACNAPSGCDIFQHQSRNELASMLMANQGSRQGHTPARLLMAFSIKLEPPRYKIAALRGASMSPGRWADRQLMGFQHCFT